MVGRVRAHGTAIALAFLLLAVCATLLPPPPFDGLVPPQTADAAGMHDYLAWSMYPNACMDCHSAQYADVYQGIHYQWQGVGTDNLNKHGTLQGKATNAMNAYCVSILGNWKTCGTCHAGRGAQPVWTSTPTRSQLGNVDCLVCHSEAYAMARTRLPDGWMGVPAGTPAATRDGYVMNVAAPTRAACLKCHAYAGGGDGVKRGDLSWSQADTADGNFDVHMATRRGNLACQACHAFVHHKVAGKGSDLKATDYAAEVKCATASCHPEKRTGGHSTLAVNSHIAHVACQTCHIPVYGKVATEIARDWRVATGGAGAFKPTQTKGTRLKPTYKWWNRDTENYLMGGSAVLDPATGAYSMERLRGGVTGDTTNKIYPFKYKIAYQPMRTAGKVLVAIDTNEYLTVSGNYLSAVSKGLFNMGFSPTDAFTTVKTDTYQLLNHTIADAQSAGGVLKCADCHQNTARMDLVGQLGYGLKAPKSVTCGGGDDDDEGEGCHEHESWPGYSSGHRKHVTNEKLDCINCHTFSRPERGLKGAVVYPGVPGELAGTVSSGGSSLAGATVNVPGYSPTTTAADGSYSVAKVTPGSHSATYSKPGYATKTVNVLVNSAATTTTNVSLTEGSFLTPVWRFYNRKNGSHFYTASEAEKSRVLALFSATYALDGVAYRVASDFSSPLHRFFNAENGSHFYTISDAEKKSVIANLSRTYSYDGPAYHVSATETPGTKPVWRFYNKKNGSHFYTASEAEKNNVVENLAATYALDGLAFYVVP